MTQRTSSKGSKLREFLLITVAMVAVIAAPSLIFSEQTASAATSDRLFISDNGDNTIKVIKITTKQAAYLFPRLMLKRTMC